MLVWLLLLFRLIICFFGVVRLFVCLLIQHVSPFFYRIAETLSTNRTEESWLSAGLAYLNPVRWMVEVFYLFELKATEQRIVSTAMGDEDRIPFAFFQEIREFWGMKESIGEAVVHSLFVYLMFVLAAYLSALFAHPKRKR